MPIYEYSCEMCGQMMSVLSGIENRPLQLKCSCGAFANSVLSVPTIIDDIEEHLDIDLADKKHPNGRVVKSRKHNAQILKEQGLYEYGPSQRAIERMKRKRRTTVS